MDRFAVAPFDCLSQVKLHWANLSKEQHTTVLGSMPMGRLVAKLAIPGSLALFVSSTYNLVDAIFVGRGVGPVGLGAVTLVMPLQFFIMAFGSLIGIGASSIVSRSLGANDVARAEVAAGNGVAASIAVGLLVALVGSLMPEQLVRLLGASGDLEAPTLTYLRIILLNEPLLILGFSANSLIRAEGQARVAMITLVVGMLTNIALDPLFIFVFRWGLAGAAWATLIGRFVTVVLIAIFYLRKRGTVRLTAKALMPDWGILREMVSIGSSGFVRQMSTSVVQMFRNHLLVVYGGTMFISAFGAVFRSIIFFGMPSMGIAQALPPIAGYNYGANNFERVRQSLKVSILAALAVTWMGFAFMQIAPMVLLRLFSSDPDYLEQGVSIMRISAFVMIAFPITVMAPGFYQALGMSMRALILALTRPVFGLIIMLVAVRIGGPLGVVSADPLAIALGAILSIVFLRTSLKQLRAHEHGEAGRTTRRGSDRQPRGGGRCETRYYR